MDKIRQNDHLIVFCTPTAACVKRIRERGRDWEIKLYDENFYREFDDQMFTIVNAHKGIGRMWMFSGTENPSSWIRNFEEATRGQTTLMQCELTPSFDIQYSQPKKVSRIAVHLKMGSESVHPL